MASLHFQNSHTSSVDDSSLGILRPEDMSNSLLSLSKDEDNQSSRGSLPKTASQELENMDDVVKRKSSQSLKRPFSVASASAVVPQVPQNVKSDDNLFASIFNFNVEDGNISLPDLDFDQEELHLLAADFSDFSDFEDEEGDFGQNKKLGAKPTTAPIAYESEASEIDIGPRAGRGVGCAGDSQSQSDVDTEDEIQAVLRQNGSSSLAKRIGNGFGQNFGQAPNSIMAIREGAEGSVVTSPILGDGGGGGDGSSGHDSESGSTPESHQTQTSTFDILNGLQFHLHELNQERTRLCPQGIENGTPSINRPSTLSLTGMQDRSDLMQKLLQPTTSRKTDSFSIRPWGDESSLQMDSLQPRDLSCPADGSEASSSPPTLPSVVSQTRIVFNDQQMSARSSTLPSVKSFTVPPNQTIDDFNHSKAKRGQKSSSAYVEATASHQQKLNPFSLNSSEGKQKDEIVNLAYYTNLKDEYGIDNFFGNGVDNQEDDFVNAAEGLAMIDLDEKQFEKDQQFCQNNDEAAKSNLTSSWIFQDVLDVSRPSWMTDDGNADRVSIGKFLESKTNPLGSLGGDKEGVERPHFGGQQLHSPRSSSIMQPLLDSVLTETSVVGEPGPSHSFKQPQNHQTNISNDTSSMLSISYISKVIAEASVSADSNTMADMIVQLSKKMKSQKKQQALKELSEGNSHPSESFGIVNNLKELPKNSKKKSEERPTRKDFGKTQPKTTDLLLDLSCWEPVRPSSVIARRTRDQSTSGNFIRPTQNVRFEASAPHHYIVNTPSILICQSKKNYPTSTPFCGDGVFPMNMRDGSWPSILSTDPTPKSRSHRLDPRTLIPPIEEHVSVGSNVAHDPDDTLTEETFSPVDTEQRLPAGQDMITVQTPKNNDLEQGTVSQQLFHKDSRNATVPPFSSVGSNLVVETNDVFLPLHNKTQLDMSDQTLLSNDSTLKSPIAVLTQAASCVDGKTVPVQRVSLRSSDRVTTDQSRQALTSLQTTQLNGCATVSLQRSLSVKIPSELKFEEVACVGIGCEANLPVQNLTSRWLKCSFHLVNLTIDGQVLPTEISPFIFKQETIVEPNSSDQVKILYVSRVPGAIVAQLQVTSQPMVLTKSIQAELTTTLVTLTAEAEHPNIEVLIDGKRKLVDFGTLPEDSCTEASLGLVNIGPATVPIRLVIHGSSKAWQGFYFPKKNLENGSSPTRSLLSPTVLTFKMNVSNPLRVLNTVIAFRAPTVDAQARESVMSLSAILNIEVDIPGITKTVLHSLPLVARVGTVHLETLKNLEPVKLLSIGDKPSSCKIPLRNSGSIPLVLEATIPHSPQLFAITPHSLQVPAGQESEITITFFPQSTESKIVGVLLLTIYPGGPAYEIQMVAETVSESSVQALHLESNKHYLAWGGVRLSSFEQQTLLLRNPQGCAAPSTIQVNIRGATQDFWLVVENNDVRNASFTVHPERELPLVVKFAPTTATHHAAKLVIKPENLPEAAKPVRFTIPLVGYGGKSCLEFVDLQQDSRGVYTAHVGAVNPNTSKVYKLLVRNTGERAAFVKVIASADDNKNLAPFTLASTRSAEIISSPNEFIVGNQKIVEVLVAIHPVATDAKELPKDDGASDSCVGNLTIFYGDEISRKRFRKAINTHKISLGSHSGQLAVNFDVAYQEEHLVQEEDFPVTPSDVQLFYSGIAHCQIQLVKGCLPQVESISKQTVRNDPTSVKVRPISCASPPVREFQSRRAATISTINSTKRSWEVIPKEIEFRVDSSTQRTTCLTKTLVLHNRSSETLQFEFTWPGHMLNITPANGAVGPRKQIEVTVMAISSDLPKWDGSVFIRCNQQHEEVKVTIKRETMNFSKPHLIGTNSSPVKIQQKEVDFAATQIGSSSEYSMELKNVSSQAQQWIMSSLSSAQLKIRDKGGAMQKVSYSAFRFTKLSGHLKSGETIDIPVTFLPLDEGEFIQRWELVTRNQDRTMHHVTIKLTGEGTGRNTTSENVHLPSKPVRKRSEPSMSKRSDVHRVTSESARHQNPIQVSVDHLSFPTTRCKEASTVKLQVNNSSIEEHSCEILTLDPPFYVNRSSLNIRGRHYVKLPIHFKPTKAGVFHSTLHITNNTLRFHVSLVGTAVT